MSDSILLHALNTQQRAAVAAPVNSHNLILAGAGSGKTRVLVHRIAWLIEVEKLSPHAILAVTFTNKAAAEMRGRLEQLLDLPVRSMWVGTFHSLAHRLLRTHWQAAQLPEHFQILDSDDQYRLIRRALKELNLSEQEWSPREAQWFINHKKDEGLRAKHIHVAQHDFHLKTMQRIYQAYETACLRSGLVDFAELLLRAHELWRDNPEILQHYQARFQHILIDEFQDTNTIQYAWIKLLAGDKTRVMVVGDDDQSIYGWRGAKIENIRRFENDYTDTQVIRLEQNYRSTATILNAANHLIDHNGSRMGKNLWTDGAAGEAIQLYAAYNEVDEARFISAELERWRQQQNADYKQIAILYRSNAQSRVIEEALLQAGIPYRVYGGQRFFERAEIKDVLAYLRLLTARNNDAAFERIVNNPPRGISDRSVAELRILANQQSCSLWEATRLMIENKQLAARAHNALIAFLNLIDELHEHCLTLKLEDQIEYLIQNSGLWAYINKSKTEKSQSRLENLEELVSAAQQFRIHQDSADELSVLDAFLSHTALESGEGQAPTDNNCVQLMTLHTAKGLEFPLVFLAGLEEGLFPHGLSIGDQQRLEEERRLCYVGMTRAMQNLVISYAEVRRLHGREEYHRPSRFIEEIPDEFIKAVRSRSPRSSHSSGSSVIKTPQYKPHPQVGAHIADSGYSLGDTVTHKKFGQGVITNFEGNGANTRVQVKFSNGDSKWLVLAYANLQR